MTDLLHEVYIQQQSKIQDTLINNDYEKITDHWTGKVIEYKSCYEVTIQWQDGSSGIYDASDVKAGSIKPLYYIFGNGCAYRQLLECGIWFEKRRCEPGFGGHANHENAG